MTPKTSPDVVVIDANVFIAICSRENDKLSQAETAINEYAAQGVLFYAPGVFVGEVLYVFCLKLQDGILNQISYQEAVENFQDQVIGILPPPRGDASLITRAEQIRRSYGCSRTSDGIYIALAEELAKTNEVEILTFDKGIQNQVAKNAPSVKVRLLVPTFIN